MIPRYSRPAMVAVWEPQTRYRIWFEIEAHACDAMAELGIIPSESAAAIAKSACGPAELAHRSLVRETASFMARRSATIFSDVIAMPCPFVR